MTITVLTLAAAHTLGIQVDVFTALLLSVVASVCACGASGVPGGSLLLIPLACGLFGIDQNVAMQGRCGWFRHRCTSGFGRNCAEFLNGRSLHSRRLKVH